MSNTKETETQRKEGRHEHVYIHARPSHLITRYPPQRMHASHTLLRPALVWASLAASKGQGGRAANTQRINGTF